MKLKKRLGEKQSSQIMQLKKNKNKGMKYHFLLLLLLL